MRCKTRRVNMSSYKEPCMHCGTLVDRDIRFCPKCGSHSPFGHLCFSCLRPISKDDERCAGCGRSLYINCPNCGQPTFADETCEQCGKSLMVPCINKRCGTMQFFQNQTCTNCGKSIKTKLGKKKRWL